VSPRHDVIKLIGSVYRAVDEPTGWAKFLEELANTTGMQSTSLSFRESINNPIDIALAYGIDASLLQEYSEDVVLDDPFREPVGELPVGRSGAPVESLSRGRSS
jgi:hypothetical protein